MPASRPELPGSGCTGFDCVNASPPSPVPEPPHQAGPAAEARRMEALHRYRILDTPDEPAFDRIATLARDLLGTPVALVSLVNGTRQWFKAHLGTGLREAPREWSFCQYTIQGKTGEAFVVPDALADPRFAQSPLVMGTLRTRFYAGVPMVAPDGFAVGTVAVLSPEPRPQGLNEAERRWLTALAAMAMDELELRRQTRLSREAAAQAEAARDAAEAARAAEEKLRRAQEAAGVVAFELTGRGGATTAVIPPSGQLHHLLGLPPDAPITLASLLAAAHPEDRPALEAEARRLAEGGGPFRQEFRLLGPQPAAPRWLQLRGECVLLPAAEDPAAWRVSGLALDISDRKATEAAHAEAEARYRALFGAAPFGVIVMDTATHRILDVNDWVCAEYGYSREEFLHLAIGDIDALGEQAAIRARGRASIVRPGTQEFEARHRTRSGEVRDVLVRVQGVRLGGREVTYGAHFDITARKAAEARLARLAAILEATPDFVGIAEAGGGGRVLYLNAPFRHALGLAEGEAPDLTLLDCHPPGIGRMLAEEALPAAARDGAWIGESAVRTADGRLLPVSQLVLAHRDAAGGIESWSTIMRDLSAQKRAEEERLLLAREVDHRAKNILAVVQAALRLTPRGDPQAYARAVEGRVMALARAHTLLAERRWTGAELRALVQGELAGFLSPGPPEAGATPRVELAGPPVTLPPAAAQGLSMALHELATNATKYGALSVPTGQVTVSWEVAEAAGRLRLRWAEAGGPPLAGPPARLGFGSRVIETTIRQQLGGAVRRAWNPGGLVCALELPLAPDRG
jgi:PAS domain S-box-containing protein